MNMGAKEDCSDAEKLSSEGSEPASLRQSIKPRHVFMISMATGIGTGLLVGNGKSIATAGVGGTLIGYLIIGVMVVCCMQSVGELVVAFPSLAGGFNSYGKKFIDPSLGFCVSWLFCLQWMVVLPLELVTASMTIKYWNSSLSPSLFVSAFYILICIVNFFGSGGYAEAEFIFNCVKVMVLASFIVLGIVIITGGLGNSGPIGFQYLKTPGAFNTNYNVFKATAGTLVNAAFSCGGVEFLALSAAEQNRDNMPKSIRRACRQVSIRMFVFYLLSISVVGLLVPYDSPMLMGSGSDTTHTSPYVAAIALHGVRIVPHIINAVILIAVVSVANSAMYSSSRTLHSLAEQNFAPRYFALLNKHGQPMRCLVVSAIVGLISFIAEYRDQEAVFVWLLSISGLSTIFTWTTICIAHIRFRNALKLQGQSLDTLGYRSNTGVIGSYIATAINVVVIIVQFWVSLFPLENNGKPDAVKFFQNYMAVPVAVLLYLGHKLYTNDWTPWIRTHCVDINTDRDVYAPSDDLSTKGVVKLAPAVQSARSIASSALSESPPEPISQKAHQPERPSSGS
ncbi:FADL272Wp [Eremothecium gossypii FDAG1]|nr:FADL272Wp [Eremothecium gossypii FDAG1]